MISNSTKRWDKLVHDIGIYGVGNIGSKVITFLMIPIYTYFLPDTGQFGYFDICLTGAFLLTPLITLNLREGFFRFLLGIHDESSKCATITTATRLLVLSLAVSLLIMLCVSSFVTIEHKWLVLSLVFSVAINDVYGQLVRGLGDNKTFVIIGLVTAFLVVILSLVLVAWLKMGIAGVFLANILARVIPVVAVELWKRLLTGNLTDVKQRREETKALLRYCLPLIPTMIIWWVLSFGDRWFVLWAEGVKVNGIYAVAARFTGIIYTFAVIIQQAWQETAILEYRSSDRNPFFSKIFTLFIFAMCGVIIAYTAALRLCYGWLVESHYASSLQYIFPMAVGAGLFSLATFLEMGYQCSKETRNAMLSSLATGIVNIGLNLKLAPMWGCWGVIAASLISFAFFATFRWIDTRRYFTLRPATSVIVPIIALIAFGIAVYLPIRQWLFILFTVILLTAITATLLRNFREIKTII